MLSMVALKWHLGRKTEEQIESIWKSIPLHLYKQGCIKFLIPHPCTGGGGFIKSFGEEFQVVKRGREFKGFWGEFHVEKRVEGSSIIYSIILRL